MKLRFITAVTTIATIIINIMANVVPYNGQTTAEISDRFKVFFVPAGYVFAIWGVIYLGLIAFTIFSLMSKQANNKKLEKIYAAVIVSNVANSVWIFLWHYNHVIWCVPVMLILLGALIYIYLKFNARKDLTKGEYLNVKIPFAVYLGWISVATIANITDALYAKHFDGFGIEGQLWAAALVVIAALLAVVFLLKYRDVAYASVFIWAALGIAVNFSGVQPLNLISFGSSLVVSVVVVYTVYKKILKKA